MNTIIATLIGKGEDLLNKPFTPLKFTKEEEIDEKLRNCLNLENQYAGGIIYG